VYSLPTLSSLYLKLMKRRMMRSPTRPFTYWGVLAVKAANNQKSRGLSRRWHSLTKTCMRWYRYLIGYRVSIHISTGATAPHSLNIQHGGRASHWGRSPVYRSSAKVQAWWNLKYMTTLHNYIKEVDTYFQQEGPSPRNSRRRLCAQEGTIFSTRLQGQVDV